MHGYGNLQKWFVPHGIIFKLRFDNSNHRLVEVSLRIQPFHIQEVNCETAKLTRA
jgi:hypothetical protein